MTHSHELPADQSKVGLIAGWGSFPVEVAEHLRQQGRAVYVVALNGHADHRLASIATHVQWMGLLKIGSHMRYFSRHGVQQIVLAGKLFKDKILYHGRGWISHLPDITCLRVLGQSFITKTRDARDDTVLNAVVNAYGNRGMKILPITKVAPKLLASEGCLTNTHPNRSTLLDIRFGWQIARQMGGLDIGQSITVRDQVVLAVEAIEGTDALITRSGQLCPRGGFTLIKVAKPNQDMRFDVPTIGLKTVQKLVRAGGNAIAVEAGKTIFVDREATLRYANQHGIQIVSLQSSLASIQASEASHSLNALPKLERHHRAA